MSIDSYQEKDDYIDKNGISIINYIFECKEK
jgi:hypothetical protein